VWWPDYAGNNIFNSFGNFSIEWREHGYPSRVCHDQ